MADAAREERWSLGQHKGQQRWLGHAMDQVSGAVGAEVLGRHDEAAFLQLQARLAPCRMTRWYTDDWGAEPRHGPEAQQEICKKQTPKSARTHLTLRTRMKRRARKTLCFAQSIQRHDIVIGLVITR